MLRHFTVLLAMFFVGLLAAPAAAQVVRLPTVEPPSEAYPGQLLSHPDSSVEVLDPPLALIEPPDPDRPPDARDGFFQKAILETTWLASGGAYGLGTTDVELKTVVALPIPSRRWPMIVTPGFAVHYLDGPTVTDLPARLYDAYTQFRWFRRFSPRWAMDLAVTPGVYSDFEQGSDEGLRITGHGAAMFTWSETTRLVFGVAYLDREDLGVLPIGGILWKPSPDLEFDLVVPRPKIARRIWWEGACTEQVQDWVYVAGEYGGGTWAVERADGHGDEVTYSDFRLLLGIERRHIGGLDGRLEAGYVFGRSLEHRSEPRDIDLNDTVLVRGVLVY